MHLKWRLAFFVFAVLHAVNAGCADKDSGCTKRKESEVCKNKETNEQCDDWKKSGYCKESSTYYGYMKDNCKKSCGLCGSTDSPAVSDCKDVYNEEKCAKWAKDGECGKNPSWMYANCEKSCSSVSDCKDKYNTTECAKWATSGECGKNPDWMLVNCEKSCKICSPSKGSATEVNDEYCGLRFKARVVGGTDAAVGDWPWQVGIVRSYNTITPFCGGSLINRQWVVTANHCFGTAGTNNIQPGDIYILLGEHDISKDNDKARVVKVSKIIRHEDYKVGSFDADIALVKLGCPVTYNALIKPVCLPDEDQDETVGESCYVTGWGRTQEGGKQAKVLQEAKLPIVSRKTCSDGFGASLKVTENMVCAGFKKGGIDACQGDSGGPFVCRKNGRFQLTGVVSFGRGCARADLYGVYAKVSKYVNWIKRKIKE